MSATYEPGTVALVQCSDGKWRRALAGFRSCGEAWTFKDGSYRSADDSDVRPLVVLDPEDAEQMARLTRALGADFYYGYPSVLAACLRVFANQTRPPKPEEPTGLWAVVEGRDGNRWVKEHDGNLCWRHIGSVDRSTSWEGITTAYLPVRVLSEGVSA